MIMQDDVSPKLAALIGIFFCSLFAAGLPIASRPALSSRIIAGFFFVGRHFGTGVILATAFAHLLQDAYVNLAKSGPRWRNAAGLTTLGALLSIFLLEYTCSNYVEWVVDRKQRALPLPSTPTLFVHSNGQQGFVGAPGPYRDDPNLPSDSEDAESRDHLAPLLSDNCSHRPSWRRRRTHASAKSHDGIGGHVHGVEASVSTLDRRTQVISIVILQVGIMMHSLIIGITLAFTNGSDFTSLLVAIFFHQMFEGISLGVRISELPEHHHHKIFTLPRILVTLFAMTVPIGILLGLFALPRQIPQVAGVMQAASAGMLIYAGTVEMLAEDFVHSGQDRLKGLDGLKALASLFAGAALMSILGIWA
ncbi:Zinc/iron permease [Auriculariales sp. MPI-PUGE-AT-0066]|nr:Zinc/iron permease [Auriculariales sp. MPI-PUGE-AT-0066]